MRKLAVFIALATATSAAPSNASPFPIELRPFRSLVVLATVQCRTYTKGNEIWEESCPDGYVCVDNHKCAPGPELQKQLDEQKRALEAEKQRIEDEIARSRAMADELDQRARDGRRESRRAGGGCMSDPNYCRLTPSPQRLPPPVHQGQPGSAGAGRSAPGTVMTYRETVLEPTYQPGSWYYWTSDWKTIPTPRYSGSGGQLYQPARRATGPAADPTGTFDCSHKPVAGGAAWDAECLAFEPEPQRRYRPSIDPQTLHARASVSCKGVEPEGYTRCIMDAKIKILMSEDAAIAKTCSHASGDALDRCVDRAYVYGPEGASPATQIRNLLRAKLLISELVDRRDEHAPGSEAWKAINDELRRLDQNLRADDIDLSEYFNQRDVDSNGNAPIATPAAPEPSEQEQPSPPGEPAAAGPGGEGAAAAKQEVAPGSPALEPKRSSDKDEIYCHFIAHRISRGDLAYPNAQAVPSECQDRQDIASAFAARPSSPPSSTDSPDRAWIMDLIAEMESYGPPTPLP